MSSLATNFHSPVSLAHVYAKNVGLAARAFLHALVGQRPAIQAAVVISQRARAKNLLELHHMADYYESTMPNFSAELRSLACRD